MRRAIFLTALILGLAGTAVGQYALRVDTIVGFNGLFRPGRWTPVHLTVQNLGADVRGNLEVSVRRGDRFGPRRETITYRRDLDLISGSTKAFTFVLPLATAVYPIEIAVTDGDQIAHQEEYDLLGNSASRTFVAVLSRRPNLDFLLPVYNSREERALDIVYPLTEFMPDQWHGYESVDAVVIHDARVQDLRPEQLIALRDWVATGGRLIISGGAHFGQSDAQILSQITELSVEGITTTTVERTGLPAAGFPVDQAERSAEVVTSVFQEFGTTIGRIPIGRGDVVVLPFDYAQMVRVAPYTSVGLWNTLLSGGSDPEVVPTSVNRRVFETDILVNQLNLPLYRFPSRLLVVGLLASYTVAVAALLIWMAVRKTRLTQLVGLLSIAVVIVLAAFTGKVALTDMQQPVEALALSIERMSLGPEDGYGIVTQDIALFSRQRASYEVRFAGNPLLLPTEGADQTIHTAAGSTTLEIIVDRWGHSNGVAVQVVEFPLTVAVQSGQGFTNLEIRNRTDQPVTGMVLLRAGRPVRVGDVAPGSVTEFVAEDLVSGPVDEIEWQQYVTAGPLASHAAQLLKDLAWRNGRKTTESGPTLELVGWLERPVLNPEITPAFVQDIRLAAVVIPLGEEGIRPQEVGTDEESPS